jgi:hypothetical protein
MGGTLIDDRLFAETKEVAPAAPAEDCVVCDALGLDLCESNGFCKPQGETQDVGAAYPGPEDDYAPSMDWDDNKPAGLDLYEALDAAKKRCSQNVECGVSPEDKEVIMTHPKSCVCPLCRPWVKRFDNIAFYDNPTPPPKL